MTKELQHHIPNFYLKHLCFATKDVPQPGVKFGHYLTIIKIYNLWNIVQFSIESQWTLHPYASA
jgi:hypothetical protein